MWEDVELRELRMLVVLSEELHFGRAAERLGVSQSRVSSRLRAMESRLGAKLVSRTSRRVAMTEQGRGLVDALRPALAGLDAALSAVRQQADGVAGTLNLGVVSPPSGGPHLEAIVRELAARHPDCSVVVHDVAVSQGLRPLRAGMVDLVAMRLPLDQPDICVGPVLSVEPRVLLVARSHRLAGRAVVTVEDLAEERVAQLSGLPPETEAAILPDRTPAGVAIPRHPRTPMTMNELVAMVAQGDIVHLTSASLPNYVAHPGVMGLPVSGLPDTRTALAWLRDRPDVRRSAFVEAARSVLADRLPDEGRPTEG